MARASGRACRALAPREVAAASRSARSLTIDGVKFLLPDDAWLLMRASGTEPLVRVYAEASSAGVVDDLLAAGRALVAERLSDGAASPDRRCASR